jgi:hypothetical protein
MRSTAEKLAEETSMCLINSSIMCITSSFFPPALDSNISYLNTSVELLAQSIYQKANGADASP